MYYKNIPLNNSRLSISLGEFFLLVSFIGYMSFIPFGPYPIIIFGSIKLDILFATTTTVLAFCLNISKLHKSLMIIYVSCYLFVSMMFVTTITSTDFEISIRNTVVYIGYLVITIYAPLFLYKYARLLKKILFFVSLIAASTILYLYFYHHTLGRMHLYNVDPNMTAIGMLMACVIILPEFIICKNKYSLIYYIISLLIIFISAIVLLSRTAIGAFFLSVFISFLWNIKEITKINSKKKLFKKIGLLISILFLCVFCLYLTRVDFVLQTYDRFVHVLSGAYIYSDDFNRVDRIQSSVELWSKDLKTLIFGNGFFTLNPHNEIIRMLSASGLLGLLTYIFLFYAFYVICCKSDHFTSIYLFGQRALFVYLLIIIQSYGHSKSLFFGFTFLLINHLALHRYFYSYANKN
jgi:hypothetical protein